MRCSCCDTDAVLVNPRRPWSLCSDCGARLRFMNLEGANLTSIFAGFAMFGVLAALAALAAVAWLRVAQMWLPIAALPMVAVGGLVFLKVVRYEVERRPA